MRMTEKERANLDEILKAIDAAEEKLDVLSKPFREAESEIVNLREMILEQHETDLVGRCEFCDRPLFTGDKGHTSDDMILCAEHAPTWGDCKKSWEKAELDMEDDKAAFEEALKAHLDGFGSIGDKVLHDL